jgi:hypothetical protein
MTVSQVRVVLAAFLQVPPASPKTIAARVTRQLVRNEDSRRAHWLARGRVAPPRRSRARKATQ